VTLATDFHLMLKSISWWTSPRL